MTLDPSWRSVLGAEFARPYFRALAEFLREERRQATVYPPRDQLFTAFGAAPFERVKVVILGQDPYHGRGQAHGMSFSVPFGVPVPPSLQNIYKELEQDVGVKRPGHGHLMAWAQQGVLLLNAVLTVREGEPGSHQNRGWETFTDAAIRALNERGMPVVFVLWGRYAREKLDLINTRLHRVVESAHPSPMSAALGFFGSRPFSTTNRHLAESGQSPIDWQLPSL